MSSNNIIWPQIEDDVGRKTQFTVIQGRVYNLSPEFQQWHPGGAVAATQIGRDGTAAFAAFHHPSTQELLANFYVCDLNSPGSIATDIIKIHQTITRNGWWKASKLHYGWKFASTLCFAYLSLRIISSRHGECPLLSLIIASCSMAIFFQQVGWLAHDFMHNQVFTERKFNHAFGFVTSCISQGFSLSWWLNKHNTHHAVPNVHSQDPDIDTMPVLAWSEEALELFSDYSDDTLSKFWILHQPILVFPLLSLVRLSWGISSIAHLLSGDVKLSAVALELLGILIHYAWQFGLPLMWLSPLRALVYFTLSQGLGSILLALVFILNHNGRSVLNNEAAQAKDFYELQILTSRNLHSGLLTDWITGGLNYQVEHHLFPSLPRHNYHLVAPLVQEACARHKIPYHKVTFLQGIREVLERLRRVSELAEKSISVNKA